MHDQRVGLVAPAAAQCARDGGRDAAAHGARRDHLHQHDPGKHQRHAGERVGAELARRTRSRSGRSPPAPPSPARWATPSAATSPRSARAAAPGCAELMAGGRHLVAGVDGNGETSVEGCDAHGVAPLARGAFGFRRTRAVPLRAHSADSIDAYRRRVRSGAAGPGANAYSGALIGRPVAESTMHRIHRCPGLGIDQHARSRPRARSACCPRRAARSAPDGNRARARSARIRRAAAARCSGGAPAARRRPGH